MLTLILTLATRARKLKAMSAASGWHKKAGRVELPGKNVSLGEVVLENEHAVSVREESVALLNRLAVCLHHQFFAGKGAHQHDEGALW